MKTIQLLSLIFFLLICSFKTVNVSNSFDLSLFKYEGTVRVSSEDGKDVVVNIQNAIEPDKVVVASVDGEILSDTNKYVIQLYDTETRTQVKSAYGRRYMKSRMTYFITSGKLQRYYLVITPIKAIPAFEVKVKVVEKLGPFRKLDSKENPSELFTYFMSNSPEFFEDEKKCLGENGWYLARGKLQSNANIYWEHCNYLGYNAKFGVLLWNKDKEPITCKLNSTSAKSWTDAGSMEPAMCGVWLDWFKNKLNDNELKEDFNKPFVLPAYNPKNPSASAKWILIQTAEKNEPVMNTFNGLINISLTHPNGKPYSGDNLFCDTYIMKPRTEKAVLANIDKNQIVPTKDALRGSGSGAMVETTIPAAKITEDKPFCFLMTGHDPPKYQDGENVITYFYEMDGKTGKLPTAFGYSVVYKFNCEGFTSDKPIKARFKFNPYTNPNALMDKWSGMYVIGKQQRNGAIFSKQVLIGQDYVFDTVVPQNENLTYYLVISGMSSLPLEVEFYND